MQEKTRCACKGGSFQALNFQIGQEYAIKTFPFILSNNQLRQFADTFTPGID